MSDLEFVKQYLATYRAEHTGTIGMFFGVPIEQLDRDDLLALVGWMGQEQQRTQESNRSSWELMSKLMEARA